MKWFAAIYLLSESKKGMSANQLKRTLKVAYKTSWYLCHRIREAVKDADNSLLNGIVEIDETWIGGKARNMHKRDWERKKATQGGMVNKTAVAGAIERGGNVRLQVVADVDYETMKAFIKQKIADECSSICTDDNYVYNPILERNGNTHHYQVNHSKRQYVFGNIHTNTLENVWSLYKRSIIGSYHKISVKHLDRYLDEFEFRFNNRNNPFLFRDTLLRLLATSNLEYKNLTKDEAA